MLSTKNYQNWSVFVETTACQSWRVFETQCSLRIIGCERRYKNTLKSYETKKIRAVHKLALTQQRHFT